MAQTVHTCIVALGVGPCMFTYDINHTYSFTVWHTCIVTLQRTFSNSTWNISVTQYYTSYHLWYKVTIKIKRIPLFMDCELFSESCYMLGNCLKFFISQSHLRVKTMKQLSSSHRLYKCILLWDNRRATIKHSFNYLTLFMKVKVIFYEVLTRL